MYAALVRLDSDIAVHFLEGVLNVGCCGGDDGTAGKKRLSELMSSFAAKDRADIKTCYDTSNDYLKDPRLLELIGEVIVCIAA